MKLAISKDTLWSVMIIGIVGALFLIVLLGVAENERDRERARQEKLDALTCPAGQIAVLEEYEGQVYRAPDAGDQSFDPRGAIAPTDGDFEDATLERAVCATPGH